MVNNQYSFTLQGKLSLAGSLIWLSLLLTATSNAQHIYQAPPNQKWGYYDRFWRKIVPPEYDEMISVGDMLLVKKGGKRGVLNQQGQVVVPVEYVLLDHYAPGFNTQYGCFSAIKNKKEINQQGIFSSTGAVIVPFQYQYVRALSDQIAVGIAANDTVLHFYKEGQVVFKTTGRAVEQGEFDETCFGVFGTDRKMRHMTRQFQWVYPDDPARGVWTDGNYTVLKTADGKFRTVIDASGATVIPPDYTSIKPGLPGQFQVYREGRIGILDGSGKVVIPLDRQKIRVLNGVYLLVNSAGKSGLVNAKGEVMLPLKYTFSNLSFDQVLARLPASNPDNYLYFRDQENRLTGVYRTDGRQVAPIAFQRVEYCSDRHPLLVSMPQSAGAKIGYQMAIDFKGNEKLPGLYYSLHFTADPDVLIGQKDSAGLYGLINLSKPNKTVFEFSEFRWLGNTYLVLIKNGDQILYTPEGKLVASAGKEYLSPPTPDVFELYNATHLPGTFPVAVVGAVLETGTNTRRVRIMNNKGDIVELAFNDQSVQENRPAQGGVEAARVEEIVPPKEATPSDKVFEVFDVQKLPSFPGGEAELNKFLAANLKYPEAARKNAVQGTVVVSFIIRKDGSLSDFIVDKGLSGGCTEEALRVLKTMPKWQQGEAGGNRVAVKYTLPVRFKLE